MIDQSQILQLGPIQLPIRWLVLFLGLFIGTLVSERMARKKGWEKDKWSDFVLTAFLITIIVYKFGWILFEIKEVIQSPQMIIWTPGTSLSLWLGVIFAVLFSIYHIKRNQLSWANVLHFSWLTAMVALFLYFLLIKDYGKTSNFVNQYRAIGLGILFVVYLRWFQNLTHFRLMLLFMGLGFGLLVLSILDINTDLILGMSQNQWIDLLLGLIGVVGISIKKEEAN